MALLFFVLLLAGTAAGAVWTTKVLILSAPEDSAVSLAQEQDESPPQSEEAATPEAPQRRTARNEGSADGGASVPAFGVSPAVASYASLVSGERGVSPGDLLYVQRGVASPSDAAVWFAAPQREGRARYFVFFVREDSKGEWEPYRSVVAGDQEFPRDIEAMMQDVPEDLKRPVLRTGQNTADAAPTEVAEGDPQRAALQTMQNVSGTEGWRAGYPERSGDFYRVAVSRETEDGESARTNVYLRREAGPGTGALAVAGVGEGLTRAELPGFPQSLAGGETLPDISPGDPAGAQPVYDGMRADDLDADGVREIESVIGEYPGTVGFYAMDTSDGSGFGVRPDEEFYSASTIKVAVMAAVYRKIDEGEMSYSDPLVTNESDWAAGAGWLRWNTPGAQTTVEDALWLMMTESDNVATNVLTRTVGGRDYVNGVTGDLGARDTELFWKLSSERAAVPALDNHTTPRDMATMLSAVQSGDGFTDESRDEMVDLMSQNSLEYWLEGGIPNGVRAANKGGWLDGSYNDVGIVLDGDEPYALAIYSMDGPSLEAGSPVIAEVSGAVWLARTGETKEAADEADEDKSDDRDTRSTSGSGDSPD